MLHDKAKCISTMQHANTDSRVGKFYRYVPGHAAELHELIIIVVEYLIVSNLGSKYGIPMVKVESCLKYGLIHIM